MRVELVFAGEFSTAEDLDRELYAAHHTGSHECLRGDRAIELQSRNGVEVDDFPGGRIDVGEAAQIRHAPLNWELAALESRADTAAGACILPLVATAGCLAPTGANTASNSG